MTYTSSLKNKLSLGTDDLKQEGKLARLLNDVKSKILSPVSGEADWHFLESDIEPSDALASDWSAWPNFTERTVWSKKQGHTWLAAAITVPEEAAGKTFILKFTSQWTERPGSTDPQCLAYLDGKIAQAIDGNHTEVVVMENAVPGTVKIMHIDAFTFFDRPLVGFKTEFFVRNLDVEKIYHDLHTPFQVAARLHQNDPRRHEIFNLIDKALRAMDRRDSGLTDGLKSSLAQATEFADAIYALQDTEVQPTITAFGHTHIDVAWLWRVLHTREKAGRSFATALTMMKEYPQFKFMYNQAVVYDFLKSDYPDLWQGIKDAVKNGQLEIEGAMWVEPDANIVSGESMVRQIMMGRKFHQTEFGVTPTCVWLPDTFGYSANMPQILEKSGLDYFLTSKLSWNDTDQHPYDTFFWKGIDGTQTKAHLITAQDYESEEIYTTYNSDLSVTQVMGSWKRYEPKAAHNELALCYGWGDGGGGPTREMVERGTRLERGIPGAPNLRLEGLNPFLQRLGQKMDRDAGQFPKWTGELYLQYHRGTLTTIGLTKRNNRLAEQAMREFEYMAALAHEQAGHPYPYADLDRLWKVVLINQFHDILPGTSIPEVYGDTDAEYAALFAELNSENGPLRQAERALRGSFDGARVYNFISQHRDGDLVTVPEALAESGFESGGHRSIVQAITRANGQVEYVTPVYDVKPLGWTGLGQTKEHARPASSLSVSTSQIENQHMVVKLDTNGDITSVYDKANQRELIAEGETANRMVAYEDKSMEWDAWDIDWYFEEQYWPFSDGNTEVTVVEEGPYRAAVKITRHYRQSTMVQVLSLGLNDRMLEIDTWIDWHEQQTVLKAVFPFDLNVSEIRSEIQFGHVTRATHRNTSWDKARFEASMHRWIDMSEPDFGVALINDCKYAYDAHDQTVRLTLVRGTTWPHPQADQGTHNLRYALMLHDGVRDLETVQHAAERFNNPMKLIGTPNQTSSDSFSFAQASASNVTIETVKRAENADGTIVRVFEHGNRRALTHIQFGLAVESVQVVDLMEENGQPLHVENNSVQLSLRPFEIVTLRVKTSASLEN